MRKWKVTREILGEAKAQLIVMDATSLGSVELCHSVFTVCVQTYFNHCWEWLVSCIWVGVRLSQVLVICDWVIHMAGKTSIYFGQCKLKTDFGDFFYLHLFHTLRFTSHYASTMPNISLQKLAHRRSDVIRRHAADHAQKQPLESAVKPVRRWKDGFDDALWEGKIRTTIRKNYRVEGGGSQVCELKETIAHKFHQTHYENKASTKIVRKHTKNTTNVPNTKSNTMLTAAAIK